MSNILINELYGGFVKFILLILLFCKSLLQKSFTKVVAIKNILILHKVFIGGLYKSCCNKEYIDFTQGLY